MSKKLFGLLLVVCLVVGLLPVVASAAEPKDATLKFGFASLKLTAYDTPVYTKNYEKETQDTAGNKFTKWGQTATGANEENYNAKYEWKTGEEGPTLTLRGFKFDEWNNEANDGAGAMEAKYENEAYTTSGLQTYGITTSKNVPTTIILTGEDSLLETKFGITYYNDLTIKSEGDTKLTMYTASSCITSSETEGADLTINANLNLSLGSFYNTAFAGAVIQTYKANLTINGGNIVCKIRQEGNKAPTGIAARGSGDLIINGGNINAMSITGAGGTNGCITAPAGKLIINGGTVQAKPRSAVGLYALKGIEINGGDVNVLSPYYGVNVGTKDAPADVKINGGTLRIMAERCFYGDTNIYIGEGVRAYAGPNEKDCEVFDGSDMALGQKPWWLSTNDDSIVVETKPAETLPSIPIFTVPSDPATTPTTGDTTEPTGSAAATDPTTATNPTTNENKGEADGGNSTTLIIVIAAVVLVAAAVVIVVIIKKRKKA